MWQYCSNKLTSTYLKSSHENTLHFYNARYGLRFIIFFLKNIPIPHTLIYARFGLT